MEGLGRVRKVKSKIKDGVETIVDKTNDKLDSMKLEDSDTKNEDDTINAGGR